MEVATRTLTAVAEVVEQPASAPVSPPVVPAVIPELAPAGGEALGRIRIPGAEVDHVMVSGVSREVLKQGPGHMPWTPLPGQPGNAVVSGHRTTYGAAFADLDRVQVGDQIYVETTIGSHTYRVREILVVEPTDVGHRSPPRSLAHPHHLHPALLGRSAAGDRRRPGRRPQPRRHRSSETLSNGSGSGVSLG